MAASDLDITSDLYFVLKTCSRTFFPMPKQWDPTPLLGVVCSACASESGFNVRKRVCVCECVCKEVLNHESVCVCSLSRYKSAIATVAPKSLWQRQQQQRQHPQQQQRFCFQCKPQPHTLSLKAP